MTEADWLASSDPQAMLEYLCGSTGHGMALSTGRASSLTTDRKLRLFACACWFYQHIGSVGEEDAQSRDLAERWADGESIAPPAHLQRWNVLHASAHEAARLQILDARMGPDPDANWLQAAALLRDIIGNPFRPVTLPKCKRCDGDGEAHGSDRPFDWTGPGSYPGLCPVCKGRKLDVPYFVAVGIAGAIYAARRFDDMPILADALEEAGCTDEAILRHCRGEERCSLCVFAEGQGDSPIWCGECTTGRGWLPLRSPHVRGCHVLDLILGKE